MQERYYPEARRNLDPPIRRWQRPEADIRVVGGLAFHYSTLHTEREKKQFLKMMERGRYPRVDRYPMSPQDFIEWAVAHRHHVHAFTNRWKKTLTGRLYLRQY